MPNQYAATIYPVPRRFIGFGKETAGSSGTAVASTNTVAMSKFTPTDKVTYLEDDAWRGAMAQLYNEIQGVEISDLSMGGPLFADSIGYPLAGILGDYWQSVNGTAGTATTLNGGTSVGATAVTLTSATGFSGTSIFAVGGTGTTSEEVRQGISLVGSVLYFTPPLYQAHLTAAAVTPYSATGITYNHNFALLNSGAGMGGFANAQPPTYTIVDANTPPASTGARQYAYAVPTELTLSGMSTGLVEWEAKYTAIASAITGRHADQHAVHGGTAAVMEHDCHYRRDARVQQRRIQGHADAQGRANIRQQFGSAGPVRHPARVVQRRTGHELRPGRRRDRVPLLPEQHPADAVHRVKQRPRRDKRGVYHLHGPGCRLHHRSADGREGELWV